MVKECVHGTRCKTQKKQKRRRSENYFDGAADPGTGGGRLSAGHPKRDQRQCFRRRTGECEHPAGQRRGSHRPEAQDGGRHQVPPRLPLVCRQAGRGRQAPIRRVRPRPRQLLRRHHRGAFRLREGRQCPADLPRGYDGHRHCEKNGGCRAVQRRRLPQGGQHRRFQPVQVLAVRPRRQGCPGPLPQVRGLSFPGYLRFPEG